MRRVYVRASAVIREREASRRVTDVGRVEGEAVRGQPFGQDVHVAEQLFGQLAEHGCADRAPAPASSRRPVQRLGEGVGELGVGGGLGMVRL